MVLTPAYGRDYESKKELMADIEKGVDFIINDPMSRWDGKPASPRDFHGKTVQFRYNKLQRVAVVKF